VTEPSVLEQCAIDGRLLDISGIREYERIEIYNVNNGKRFAIHGVVDEYMGIPPAARRVLECVDGGRFRIVRNVAPDLLFYSTVFAVTADDANRLDRALDGPPVSVLVRLFHAPPTADWR